LQSSAMFKGSWSLSPIELWVFTGFSGQNSWGVAPCLEPRTTLQLCLKDSENYIEKMSTGISPQSLAVTLSRSQRS
jgi:hypothetical protein